MRKAITKRLVDCCRSEMDGVLNYLYYCKVLMNIAKENVSVLQ
jgi:hypothetical protein